MFYCFCRWLKVEKKFSIYDERGPKRGDLTHLPATQLYPDALAHGTKEDLAILLKHFGLLPLDII